MRWRELAITSLFMLNMGILNANPISRNRARVNVTRTNVTELGNSNNPAAGIPDGDYVMDGGMTHTPSVGDDVTAGFDPDIDSVMPTEKTRVLLDETTVMVGMRAKIFVPLEIISDVDIKAMVIDDQELTVNFDLELNREPERKDYYRINFSEKELDLDGDGKIDTKIYTPEFANSKIVDSNYVVIQGANITKDGTYFKRVNVTVEVE